MAFPPTDPVYITPNGGRIRFRSRRQRAQPDSPRRSRALWNSASSDMILLAFAGKFSKPGESEPRIGSGSSPFHGLAAALARLFFNAVSNPPSGPDCLSCVNRKPDLTSSTDPIDSDELVPLRPTCFRDSHDRGDGGRTDTACYETTVLCKSLGCLITRLASHAGPRAEYYS
jgi:hypothetical protein